jgi:hypothetical protein
LAKELEQQGPASSNAALIMSLVSMPFSDSEFDRNINVHAQLERSVLIYKSSGTLWPHRIDMVSIMVHVHVHAHW